MIHKVLYAEAAEIDTYPREPRSVKRCLAKEICDVAN
jgi:hypothetical protein